VLVDPRVDPLPPQEEPLDAGFPLGGDLVAGHLPPPHHDHLVHGQLAPHVADGEHVVETGVGHEHDVRVGSCVQGGQ